MKNNGWNIVSIETERITKEQYEQEVKGLEIPRFSLSNELEDPIAIKESVSDDDYEQALERYLDDIKTGRCLEEDDYEVEPFTWKHGIAFSLLIIILYFFTYYIQNVMI